MSDCIFCNKEKLDTIYSDDFFYVIRDEYPDLHYIVLKIYLF